MAHNYLNRNLRHVVCTAALLGSCCVSLADEPVAPAVSEPIGPMFVVAVDQEDHVDLAEGIPAQGEIVKGLFPEDAETAKVREIRKNCEGVIAAGYKCMPPARSFTRYSLPGASFSLGSWSLPDVMKAQLRSFADVLRGRQSKEPAVRIDGHADATGSAEANLALSQRRAESVRDYLVSLGVSANLLSVQGYGSSKLRNAQDPAASENRRVEIARNLEMR